MIIDNNIQMSTKLDKCNMVLVVPGVPRNSKEARMVCSLFENCSHPSFTIYEDGTADIVADFSRENYALFTSVYDKLENIWAEMQGTKDTFKFMCSVEHRTSDLVLIPPVYMIRDGEFTFSPKNLCVQFSGILVKDIDSDAYDIKCQLRKIYALRDKSNHEFATFRDEILNEKEQTEGDSDD